MACPMILSLATDVPVVIHRVDSLPQNLEPKSVLASASLREFASRNGWKTYNSATPPGFSPDPFEDCTKACDVEKPHKVVADDAGRKPQGVADVAGKKTQPHIDSIQDGEPAHKEIGLEVARLSMKQSAKSTRWWTMPQFPVVCKFSGFPINLLPYPPFKLRQIASEPNPHSLVDGKYLALLMISTGSYTVNGRCLEQSEIDALGKHMHRCKLGPYRPDLALSLAQKAANSRSQSEREESIQALSKMRATARCELGKLRWIQEQRLFQLLERLTSSPDAGVSKKMQKQESRRKANHACAAMPIDEAIPIGKQGTGKYDSNGSISTCSLSTRSCSSESEDNFESLVDFHGSHQQRQDSQQKLRISF